MISSIDQSLAFKAVYCNKHTMTKAQNVVADKIFAKLYQMSVASGFNTIYKVVMCIYDFS